MVDPETCSYPIVPSSDRSMLRAPLCDWHHAHSGRMVTFAGWDMPIQYTSIVEEHTAVRERVGIFDIAHMGRLYFRGPDAMSLLDHLLTNDVTKLKVGQVRYSLICRSRRWDSGRRARVPRRSRHVHAGGERVESTQDPELDRTPHGGLHRLGRR